ncbi:MAG: hypothetical protein K2K16_00580 [Ruminococcus sp.]|nr:hypothetical protein [Ruminococcus sp.]MDE6670669.1 hypothetical protein [Ruminococcus sp.]
MKDIKFMQNIRQWIYTFLLIVTCFVASPIIFRQIWKSSKDVAPTSSKKPPVIDINNTGTQPVETIPSTENISGFIEENTQPVTEQETIEPAPVFVQSDPSYFDDALFIGDSRTVGIYEYGTLKNADYFCSVGLASYKVPNEYDANGLTIYDKLSNNNYGKIYIMLGINEVGNDFTYTVNSYLNLISTIKQYQPDAIIYIMANLHVSAERQLQGDSVTNENINALNQAQSEFADNHSIFYIDVNQIFDDTDGNLMYECSNDGVHVLAKYYQTWCEWLCKNTIPVNTPEETTAVINTDVNSGGFVDTSVYNEVPAVNNDYIADDPYIDYGGNYEWNY